MHINWIICILIWHKWVRSLTYFRVLKGYFRSGCPSDIISTSLLSFQCKSVTATKSPQFFRTTFSESLTNLTVLLPQSRDSSCYVSRPILALPPLWLHKHTVLRAQIFAHCHEWSHDFGSLSLPAPEAGDFVELLLLLQTADISQAYHLISIKYTAAVLKAVMCNSVTSLVLKFWGSRFSLSLQLTPVFTKECFCSLRGHIMCVCYLAYRFLY